MRMWFKIITGTDILWHALKVGKHSNVCIDGYAKLDHLLRPRKTHDVKEESPQLIVDILNRMEDQSGCSTRAISRDVNLFQTTVWCVLKGKRNLLLSYAENTRVVIGRLSALRRFHTLLPLLECSFARLWVKFTHSVYGRVLFHNEFVF